MNRATVTPSPARPKRVLVVGPLPPPNGGMALQTELLVRKLRAEGLDVDVIATNAGYRPAWLGRIPVLRAFARLVPYLLKLWRGVGRAELVHVLGNSGWAWYLFAAPVLHICHWRRTPVLMNYHGGLAETFFAKAWPRVWFSLRHADAISVSTEFLQQVFARHGVRTDIVPNILDHGNFQPVAHAVPQLHIVVTRNLEALYDNASAIRCLALVREQIPDARLTLAGEGPERAALEQLADSLSLGDAVHFAGRLPSGQVARLLQTARVVLNPSTADNTPISLIEAMATGIPIVSTAVGGVPQLCRPEREALLVPAGDVAAMADAILRLHRDEATRQSLISAGLKRATDFGWDAVWSRLSACYANAMGVRA